MTVNRTYTAYNNCNKRIIMLTISIHLHSQKRNELNFYSGFKTIIVLCLRDIMRCVIRHI